MIKRNKILLIIDAVLLLGTLISIFLFVGYTQPLAIAPIHQLNGDLLFYLPKTDFILIDENTRFDSARTIFIGNKIELHSGRYFIKFFDGLKSEIRQIDIEVETTFEFREIENKVGVFNLGNKALRIETYDKGSLINSSIAYTGRKDE